MWRWCVVALLVAGTGLASAQVAPGPPQQPQQPGTPQPQPPGDPTAPNAVPGAPPTFVPGLGPGGDTSLAAAPRVVRMSGAVSANNIVSKVNPVYPADAKAAHVEGSVILLARLGRTGHVESLSVVSGPQPLRAAAMTAVKQWVYRPYKLNGEAVDVDTTITLNFNLR